MAFCQPGFTLSVINQRNQIVRESNQGNVRTACLEFGEEYRLRIKNKTHFRAYVAVTIDGMEVFPGRRFLLGARQTLDLERFVLDGDLTKGRRFKFISLEEGTRTGEIQDPTSPQNGLISVVFHPESMNFLNTPINWTNQPLGGAVGGAGGWVGDGSSFLRGMGGVGGGYGSGGAGSAGGSYYCSTNSAPEMAKSGCTTAQINSTTTFTSCTEALIPTAAVPRSQAGATVEGSESTQSFFETREFFATDAPVTMTIQLKGRVQPTIDTYSVSAHCGNCGVRTTGLQVPKGQHVSKAACPNCGVTGLTR